MKVSGQLERAQLENTTADPAAGITGRVTFNTVSGRTILDDGALNRALLRNDQKLILGNSGTAADNIRLHRGAVGVLQTVSGADVTAEGTLSTALNQFSSRHENYTTGGKPAFGNAGRIIWDTTLSIPIADTGAAWLEIRTGTVGIANGGTGQTTANAGFNALSPMTTGGDTIYGGASGAATRLPNGSLGQFLQSQGGTSAPIWADPYILPPTIQTITASGAGTYEKNYTFIITAGSATAGATYTNNAVTFTVHATVAGALKVVMHGNGSPSASGTLTKSAGTGDATITFTRVFAPAYLKILMVGGGGGGAGAGTSVNAQATNGADTTFSAGAIIAGGGVRAPFDSANGVGTGGVTTIPAGIVGIGLTGGSGSGGGETGSSIGAQSPAMPGAPGGSSSMGGAGGGAYATAGSAGVANTGGGGGGGGSPANQSNFFTGGGGGAGGFIDAIIYSPSATYTYIVGAGGAGGTANGTGNRAGGAGGSGLIMITEYYQ